MAKPPAGAGTRGIVTATTSSTAAWPTLAIHTSITIFSVSHSRSVSTLNRVIFKQRRVLYSVIQPLPETSHRRPRPATTGDQPAPYNNSMQHIRATESSSCRLATAVQHQRRPRI
ncbi:hypothetical protein PIB30_005654 [Stylosanthes scabra]|uniref:Uncharacterized protein n=1 Tax=Stylosanthes scabra TaxID=79078 RepID=A0ABU6T3X4_9FABA|nr:hypothetical protein [Stylosanthes scabra]